MKQKDIQQILLDTAYTRTGGSAEEERTAHYLRERSEVLGAKAWLESFPVQMGELQSAELLADGKAVPCKGYLCCGSGEVEAPLKYLPNTDKASLAGVKGQIVLLDSGVSHFLFQDLVEAGALGFITYDGNVNFRDNDIDQKELRAYVADGKKLPGVNINAKDAVRLIREQVKMVKLSVQQREYEGTSHNVVAELPGSSDKWMVFTAHYDSTSLSEGAYDNMTGCIGLLGILEALAPKAPHRYGLRFVFCGSEERGLLGSKAYTDAHAEELQHTVLNINLDMLGTYMGKFIACCTAEDKLVSYLRYRAQILGWGVDVSQGVYSSDSTPFADKGIPAVSFARAAGAAIAPIHNRYDTRAVVSPLQLRQDIDFLVGFSKEMADAVHCPVTREIPENMKKELDYYLNRKRRP